MSAALSRRLFLAGAGSLALSARAAAPSDRITVGMIAVGSRAQQLIDAIKQVPNVEIVSVYDAYTGRVNRAIERVEGRPRAAKDYREIIDDKSIDVAVIASPDHWHRRQVIEALEAGKDVYCEKPLTYTIDQGVEIADAVKRTGRLLQVGSQGVSSASQQKAREMIQAGRLGRVTMVRAYYNRNSPGGAWIYPIPPDASPETVDWETFLGSAPYHPFDLERFFRWRCYDDYSGGIATDLFVHLTTTIHYLMNAEMPSDVVALGDLYRWKESRNVPDTLNAVLRYPGGFTVNLSSTFNNRSAGTGFEFLGTEGSISLGYRGLVYQPESGGDSMDWIVDAWPSHLREQYLAENPETRSPRPEPEEFRDRSGDSTLQHFENFFDSVRTRKPVIEDAWAGHHAAAAAHLINHAARHGGVAKWDGKKGAVAS